MKNKVTMALAGLLLTATMAFGAGTPSAEASHACSAWQDHTHRVVGNSRIKYRHVNHGWNYYLVIRYYNGQVTDTWRNYSCVA